MSKPNSGAKGKGKQPAKPVQPEKTLIKLWLESESELSALKEIKRLMRTDVGSKAIIEVMHNYPKILKRADGLNAELQKINRDYENVSRDLETIRRAFNVILGTAPKPKPDHTDRYRSDDDDDDHTDPEECQKCGNDDFDYQGKCMECGTSKNDPRWQM